MATIGLDSLVYAPINEDPGTGEESYGAPVSLAKAMTAGLTIEFAEAHLYADDALAETFREFKSGKLSLGVDEIGTAAARALTGAQTDANGVLVSSGEDGAKPVAVGFRARKSNNKYRLVWLYRVKFSVPNESMTTKGDSVSYSTPTIEGTIMVRSKRFKGTRPWKTDVTEGDKNVPEAVIKDWFKAVYEPSEGPAPVPEA